MEMVDLLGQRTGELHLALADAGDRKEFAPEPFTKLYQRSIYQNVRSQIRRTMSMVRRVARTLNDGARSMAEAFIQSEPEMLAIASRITDHKITGEKIRVHGDYHLGQVLFTGRDFMIIDMEGEPARTLSERRLKFNAFKDVAGMIRSFHYAVSTRYLEQTALRPEDAETLEPWVETWFRFVASTFMSGYLRSVDGAGFVPADSDDVKLLLNVFMLEKAVYEIGYEINNRPDWLMIPLHGVKHVVENLDDPA
jgi:maltose alpha-D-glucosyltransferase/alpha-amylase